MSVHRITSYNVCYTKLLRLAATMIVHILLHWDWVVNVGVKFFKKLFHSSRFQFVVDVVLLVAFVLVMMSGILISRSVLSVLGIHLQVSRTWELLHRTSADVTLFLTAFHFALHWNWVVNATKRFVFRITSYNVCYTKLLRYREAYENLFLSVFQSDPEG